MLLKLLTLFTLSIFSLSLYAEDEIIDRHLGLCDNFEARAYKKDGSTCQVLVKNDVFPSRHFVCRAEIGDEESPDSCLVIIALVNNNGFLAFQCGKPGQEPLIQDQGGASSNSYHVSGLVTQADGSSHVIRDTAQYTFIKSQFIGLSLVEKFGAISVAQMFFGDNEFRKVNCR